MLPLKLTYFQSINLTTISLCLQHTILSPTPQEIKDRVLALQCADEAADLNQLLSLLSLSPSNKTSSFIIPGLLGVARMKTPLLAPLPLFLLLALPRGLFPPLGISQTSALPLASSSTGNCVSTFKNQLRPLCFQEIVHRHFPSLNQSHAPCTFAPNFIYTFPTCSYLRLSDW